MNKFQSSTYIIYFLQKSKNRLSRFHSQEYVNGSRCDLTGKERQAQVRVRFSVTWCTVEYCYDAVQYNMVLHTPLLEVRQYINQRLNPQKTPHTSAVYDVSFVDILEKFFTLCGLVIPPQKFVIIDLGNGPSPVCWQSNTWSNADILTSGPSATNCSASNRNNTVFYISVGLCKKNVTPVC